MAKQIITKILDDLDGGDAEETVTFALDGVGYEIDLSAKNASVLREFMAKYQDAGTRTGRTGSPAQLRSYGNSRPAATNATNREENARIREWANAHGYSVSERGRIPQFVADAYMSKTPHPDKVAADDRANKLAAEMAAGAEKQPRRRRASAAA